MGSTSGVSSPPIKQSNPRGYTLPLGSQPTKETDTLSMSTDTTKIASPVDEDQLAALVALDPDRDAVDERMATSPEYQADILGVLLKDADVLARHVEYLRPCQFVSDAHQTIYKALSEHWGKYQALPTPAQLRQAITDATAGRDASVRVTYLAALTDITEYHSEYLSPAPVDAFLTRFIHETETKIDLHKLLATFKKGTAEEGDKSLLDMAAKRERIRAGGAAKVEPLALDAFLRDTDSEYRYLVPGRIPAGKLAVAPGPAKGGKTTLLLQSFVDLVFDGEYWGVQATPFPFVYCDYENDTAYIKRCILDPVMRERDWRELSKWLYVSNRQVDHPAHKLPDYITPEHLGRLAAKFDRPAVFLIDSLRRAFGRKPGLKGNWEWEASTISGLLDPFSEWCHQSGHTVVFIHHTNHQGRSSGSTDIIAVPDVLYDFEIAKDTTGESSTRRRVRIGGRIDHTAPHSFEFTDGRYQYLGAGGEVKQSTLALVMADVIRCYEAGDTYAATDLTGLLKHGRDKINDAVKQLKDAKLLVPAGRKLCLTEGWREIWHPLKVGYGIRD